MLKSLKYTLRFVGLFALLCVLIILFWIGWMRLRPPLQFLQNESEVTEALVDSSYTIDLGFEKRTFVDMTLRTDSEDSIQFMVSFPQIMPEKQYPVLLILGGLEIGRQSLQYIPYHGENILIAYQYPYSPAYWYRHSPVSQVPKIQSAAFSVPDQVTKIGKWVHSQSWAEQRPVNLLGYSFGAMFLPAVYHLAQSDSAIFGPGILAYGGADLYNLFRANLEAQEPWKSLGAWLLDTAVYPLEPLHHTSYMKGEFLLINGKYDDQIPKICWEQLQEAVPEPKTIMILEAGHMNPKKPELTMEIVKYSQDWLAKNGAINVISWYE